MRLPLIDPAQMNTTQTSLYEDITAGISAHFTAFETTDPGTGALIGPWNAMLHEPEMGAALWALSKVAATASAVPPNAREIAILVVGSHYKAPYELYAHVAVAQGLRMSRERLSALCAGVRPSDLNTAEGAAFDAATALAGGGVLPEPCYCHAVDTFGQHGANQLFYLIGLYCTVAVLLNAYNVPVPERQ
jgi:4-carboxymuconolactone decarboxylase